MLLLVAHLTWSVRIDGGENDACYSMAISPRGYPVVAGNYGDALYVAALDRNDGGFIWQYIFAFPGNGRSNVKTVVFDPSDSGLVVGGTVYPYSGDDQSCGFVAKLDSGSTVWMYVDSADGCSRREGFSGVVIGGDGHYYAYGTDYETYSADLFTPSRRFVLKLNKVTGSKVWRYQPGGYSYTDAVALGDTTVAVGFGADGEVQAVDPSGNEVWSITPNNAKFWDVTIAPNGHPVVSGIKDGDFYVSQIQRETGGNRWYYSANGSDNSNDVALSLTVDGSYVYAAGYLNNGINGYDAYIVKLDTLGNLIWSYTYNGPFNSDDAFRRVVVAPDGGVVAGGYSVGAGTGRDVLLVKINASGDTVWTFTYDSPYSMDDDLRAMVWDGNGIYACATSYSSPTDRDVVVLRFDDPTKVAEGRKAKASVFVRGYGITLEGVGVAKVYDVTGRKRMEVRVYGKREIKPGRGVWFVRFGDGTYKVILK